jgi:hypothetical protein
VPDLARRGSAARDMTGEAASGGSPSPRAELVWSLVWIAVGAAIFYGGFAMDRLERQHINPYTAPGLVPALLGAAIALMGAILLVRSVRAGGWTAAGPAAAGRTHFPRLFLALGLCLAYGGGLVGRGLPFWLATLLFAFVAIAALQWRERRARRELGRGLLVAALCAAGTAAGVTLVFQELFLVRLP